jgi:hypothetical protein
LDVLDNSDIHVKRTAPDKGIGLFRRDMGFDKPQLVVDAARDFREEIGS